MPWKETGPVHERMRFIEAYLSGFYTITELAARYGVVLPDLARDVQAQVAGALATTVDLDVEAVDVSIEELEGA